MKRDSAVGVDDNVVMVRCDGFGQTGWVGVVTEEKKLDSYNTIRVQWSNGKSYLHEKRSVKRLDEANEPNLAFLMRKERS